MDRLTLTECFQYTVERWPNRPSLAWADEEPMTYSQLAEQVSQVAAFMRKKGIRKGDRVAILSENSPNWGIAYLAVTTSGAVVVPILPEFHANEIMHILRHSGSRAIFVSKRYFDRVEDTSFDLLETLILLDDFSIIPPETTKDRLTTIISDGRREVARLAESALQFAGLASPKYSPMIWLQSYIPLALRDTPRE
jgi:long-chain acyl-CoA synthetase